MKPVLQSVRPDPSEVAGENRLPQLVNDWGAFLGCFRWQLFATFTFASDTHPEAAAKRYRHWVKLLDESNGYRERSRSTYNRRCIWARGLEWQKRGVIHFHALIGNLPHERTSRVQRELLAMSWFDLGNTGFAKVDEYDGNPQAATYIAKYVAKDGEIDLSPNLQRPDLVGAAWRC